MHTQTNYSALVDFMLEVVDCSADYEEDAFRVDFNGNAYYVERYTTHFYMETVDGEVFELPRP